MNRCSFRPSARADSRLALALVEMSTCLSVTTQVACRCLQFEQQQLEQSERQMYLRPNPLSLHDRQSMQSQPLEFSGLIFQISSCELLHMFPSLRYLQRSKPKQSRMLSHLARLVLFLGLSRSRVACERPNWNPHIREFAGRSLVFRRLRATA